MPGGLVNTVDARASWLGYDGPTLTKHGVMSQLTGYDASHLLPPFMPAFRGEDRLIRLYAPHDTPQFIGPKLFMGGTPYASGAKNVALS